MNGRPKVSLLQGSKAAERRQDMRDVLKEAARVVEEEDLERLMIIIEREDTVPEMFVANMEIIPILGTLSYIEWLVKNMQFNEMPETPEDPDDADAPQEE